MGRSPGKISFSSDLLAPPQKWEGEGTWQKVWDKPLEKLDARNKLQWSECFIGGTFAPAKKGPKVVKTKRGKGSKVMVVAVGHEIPVAIAVESASPHEVKLAESALKTIDRKYRKCMDHLLADNAHDSLALRDRQADIYSAWIKIACIAIAIHHL